MAPQDPRAFPPVNPSVLKGAYAFSYAGYMRAIPPYPEAKAMPTLGAYVHRLTDTPSSFQSVFGFMHTPGYVVISFTGWVGFNGDGTLTGAGRSQIAGEKELATGTQTGNYALELASHPSGAQIYSGIFTTEDPTGISIEHYFVAADNFRELKFMVKSCSNTKGDVFRKIVASGTLLRI